MRAFVAPPNLLTSLVLILPALVVYQVGELFSDDVRNGADLITGPLLRLLHTRTNFLLFDGGLLLLFAILMAGLRRKQAFDIRQLVPVLLESAIYAVSMGIVIAYVMQLIGINPKLIVNTVQHGATAAAGAVPPGVLDRIAVAFGAGVNEELVFRLAMIPTLSWLFARAGGLMRFASLLLAFVISSLLFSAAHHVIGGEPWRLAPFVYRFFCGIIFAALFQFRGLAVAVYTHALYDVWVMVFH